VGLQIARYGLLWILSFGLSTAALIWLIAQRQMEPVVAKVLVEAGIVVLNYLLMHHMVFRVARPPVGDD
jgi:hypothetical protein